MADITADRSGLLWIGTHGSGVDVYDPQRRAFTIYRHDPKAATSLASDNVWAVYEDQDGVLWIGTQDRGLDRFDRRSGQVVHYPPDPKNPSVWATCGWRRWQQDQTGALWVGTYGGGLYRLDPALGASPPIATTPPTRRASAMTPLLTCTWTALAHSDRHARRRSQSLRSARHLYSLSPRPRQPPEPEQRLGLGHRRGSARQYLDRHAGCGLNRLEPATGYITRYQHDPQNPASLSDDSIWTLHMDRSGVLWVGTFGGGLDRFDSVRGTFTHYRERDGLASDRVVYPGGWQRRRSGRRESVERTGRGLAKLNRERTTFQTYDTTAGLPLTEYNRGRYRTHSGELLLSSMHGLIAFDPAAVQDDAYVPPVVFTNLLANKPVAIGATSPLRQVIDQADTIELTYADRVISFEFAALNYRAPRQSRYRYKLEGFDDDWTEVGSTQRLVTYTNLDPGRYVFRVTAASADGVWNEAGRAIAGRHATVVGDLVVPRAGAGADRRGRVGHLRLARQQPQAAAARARSRDRRAQASRGSATRQPGFLAAQQRADPEPGRSADHGPGSGAHSHRPRAA